MIGLFENEKIDFDQAVFPTTVLTDERINQKYARGEVRIVTEQARYPLSTIAELFRSDNYKMNPEFQRRHRWRPEQQSRLVESFIMNVPVPPVFLYEDQYSHYEVMDGLQRLTAIVKLYRNELVLEGLEEWPELNGRTYEKLPEQVRRGIDRRYLSSIILLHETARSEPEARRLKQLVFERLNSGGVKLESQESRNAVLNGPMNQLCIRLARNPSLCRAWMIPEPTPEEILSGEPSSELLENPLYRSMADAELVLRFFAFRQDKRKGSLEEYLDTYLERANTFSPELLGKLEVLFVETISLVVEVLDENAFRIYRRRKNGTWHWPQRAVKMVYDSLMAVFSAKLSQRELALERRAEIVAAIEKVYEVHDEEFEGVYRNVANLDKRIELFEQAIDSVLRR